MIIIENRLDIPLDVLKFLNEYIIYEELTDSNFQDAIKLWFENEELCTFKYGHISNWKTGKVTNMSFVFYCKIDFNEDLSQWNVNNVTNMNGMFYNARSFNSNLSNWNISNVKTMSYMFRGASSFNSNLTKWNIRNVSYMYNMFYEATSFNLEFKPIKN